MSEYSELDAMIDRCQRMVAELPSRAEHERLKRINEELVEALASAPRPLTDPSAADLVPYMDWFFTVRIAALTRAKQEERP